MSSQNLPENDHVSRYFGFDDLDEEGLPSPGAFELREGEEYLSVDWLEFLLSLIHI